MLVSVVGVASSMAARTQTIATGTSLVAARFHGLKGCEAKRSSVGVCGSKLRAGSMVVVRAAHEASVDVKENSVSAGILPSGEWSENFSLLNYEDLTKYYEPKLFKPEVGCACSLGVKLWFFRGQDLSDAEGFSAVP